jgi:carotenoid cleavage dioxygenase-like enzyme
VCAAEKLKGLLSFYRSLRDEYDYWLSADLVEGTIPAELQGSLFRC